MKNLIIIIFISIFIYALTSSCEKMFGTYLDKAPGVDVTLDTIFSNKVQSDMFLATCYEYCTYTWYAIGSGGDRNLNGDGSAVIDGATDEAECVAPWFASNLSYNVGNLTANSQYDMLYTKRLLGMRKVNIYLENIDKVQGMDPAYLARVKAEARFLRAFVNWEAIKYYGGIPIIDHSFTLTENWFIKRSSLQASLDFAMQDCDYAIANLPPRYVSADVGHATKIAAMCLKSRMLLYMASPLWNTATPYLDLPGHNDLICLGNYDLNRWQVAADAAKAVLDNALASGYALVTDQGVDKNYKYMWQTYDNSEILFSNQVMNGMYLWYDWPQNMGGLQGNTALFNFQMYFEKKDGTPQTWNMNGGDDLLAKYASCDPRLYQMLGVQNQDWNSKFPKLQLTTTPAGRDVNGCSGGAWWHKPIPDWPQQAWVNIPGKYPVYRLAEFYLNYAEALNEANNAPPQAAYDAVATVRARSGMPPFPAGMTKDQFRAKLQNEITIEYGFEEMRLFNIRRWMIAEREGVMKGNMWGIKIYPSTVTPGEYKYVPYVYEIRTWYTKMYLNPFMQSEVNKGYIINNPGY